MGRISNTWALAKTSWSVLKKDRELLWIPVLAMLVSLAVIAVTAALAWATRSTTTSGAEVSESVSPAMIVVGLLGMMALGVSSVFFNGALVAGAHQRLTGGDPTVASSIGRAFARIGGLVPWAILATTVGLILQAMRERSGWLGRMVISLIDMAWEVVTFLTVPAIVIDDLGAISGLKRSANLLKYTWGENLVARVGFGILGFLLIIPALVVAGIGVATGVQAVAITAIAVGLAWLAVVMVVMSALSAIFQTALYLYATTGRLPSGFEQAPLRETFIPK